jgi:hypothetical protein
MMKNRGAVAPVLPRAIFNLPEKNEEELGIKHDQPLDVPDKSFTGPF